MATVFLAEDERLGRKVAVKRLHADSAEDVAQRFQREAKLGASLNHPNIVAVYDTETEAEGVLIIMEFVDGETLREEILRGPLEPPRALEILGGVAAALDHAHDHGVVHRDVKPANVLLSAGGNVKLADLGIATAAERTQITHSGTVLGTAAYMAPERLDGHAGGPEVDVYALAAVAFEALSGRKAVTGKTALEVARRVISQPPPDLAAIVPGTPPGAAAALRRGLSKEPAERQHSAGELVRQLERSFTPHTRHAPPAAAPVPAPAPPRTPVVAEPENVPPPKGQEPPPEGASARPAAAAGAEAAGEPGTSPESVPASVAGARADAASAERRKGSVADRPRPLAAAGEPRGERPGGPRWAIPAAIGAAACVVIALIMALGSGGTPSSAPKRSAAGGSNPRGGGAGRSQAGGSGATAGSAPGDTGASATTSLDPSTPEGAVNSFYTLPTRGDFNRAWALGTPALHNQVNGFASWKAGESDLKSITFPTLRVTRNTGTSATVALVSAANHGSYTDHCTGTVDVVRSGSTWMLEQLHIADCPRSSNAASR
ncbi:MAG: hypothetical protein NVSMB25_24740 [Thermoleophilaceae bacterium]